MIRPLYTWLLFGLCLALATAAMGWVSWKALELEGAEALARAQAAHEGDVRLALWRMDSALAPLIAQESARPYFMYQSFYPAERAYTRMYAELEPDEILLPSPLLTFSASEILVHFQIGPDGKFTSPQVPQGSMLDLAETGYVSAESVAAANQKLADLAKRLRRDLLVVALPEPLGVPVQQVAQLPAQMADASNDRDQMVNVNPPAGDPRMQQSAEDQQRPGPQPAPQRQSVQPQGQRAPLQPGPQPQQQLAQQGRTKGSFQNEEFSKSTREYNKRSGNTAYVQQMANFGNGLNRPPIFGKDAAGTVNEGIVKAVWAGDALVLARRVSANGREYVQGCLLDWPAIKTALLTDITDLLPHAALERVQADVETTPERERQMLAAIPVRLIPGPTPVAAVTAVTPIRISLALAWACLLLAAGAIGMLMLGAVTLSERRGAFVSAVTHELRTPLTTLRMYTEMLAAGMIREDAKKQSYLQTMQAEADRLGHLVENVLAYSRIERGRARGHVVTLAVGELIAGVQRRLSERAEHAGMRLAVAAGDGEAVMVRADPSVVEQILFNLVDNACKYAASAEDRSIHLSAGRENGHVVIRVRDHGPGIGAVDQRRLFRPFSKSAREAANTAPGVGLGLALSRRLARELGGDLQLENGEGAGARFVLTLPASAG